APTAMPPLLPYTTLFRSHDAQFAGARGDHLAVHEHEVTEIDIGLPGGQRVGAHAVQADHRLQFGAVALLQGGEAQLAGIAHEDRSEEHTSELQSRENLVC